MSRPAQPSKPPDEDSQGQKTRRENVMRIALTSEARQRLTNVRMVKPELASSIEEYILQLASSGKLKRVIDDDQLKELLMTLQERKRDIRIRRI
jgi:programmed cell death protein 5